MRVFLYYSDHGISLSLLAARQTPYGLKTSEKSKITNEKISSHRLHTHLNGTQWCTAARTTTSNNVSRITRWLSCQMNRKIALLFGQFELWEIEKNTPRNLIARHPRPFASSRPGECMSEWARGLMEISKNGMDGKMIFPLTSLLRNLTTNGMLFSTANPLLSSKLLLLLQLLLVISIVILQLISATWIWSMHYVTLSLNEIIKTKWKWHTANSLLLLQWFSPIFSFSLSLFFFYSLSFRYENNFDFSIFI